LRRREIRTIFRIGCRRATIARLMAAEIFIVATASGTICGLTLLLVDRFSNDLVRMLFIR
jgi:hypothetical protein